MLEGEQVSPISSSAFGFEIGEIKAVYLSTSETSRRVLVLGTSMPLDEQDATAIYDYLESCYCERLEKAADRKREAALKYLGIS